MQRGAAVGADSGGTKSAARQRKATQRVTAEAKTSSVGERPVASPVPGNEPERRGAAPALPTPIATFNI
jgi:hypothetical protein